MQKIVPHLWFDKEASRAARWYTELFEESRIISIGIIPDTPSGNTETVEFELAGQRFNAISAGPYFAFNPAVSFMVACSSQEEVDRLYESLSAKGTVLMPIGEYPFSKRYAWVQDLYGLSWQLMLTGDGEKIQKIRPTLLFSGAACGRAEEAINYYTSVFKESSKGVISYYKKDEPVDARAEINYCELNILGNQMIAMDHGHGGDFTFNEAFSFMILCANQEEIDYYWQRLSHVSEAEQCGWAKDKFGVSWQVVPAVLRDIFSNGTKEEVKRVTEAFLKMKKLDIAALEKARLG